MTVQSKDPNKISIRTIIKVLENNCEVVDLRRLDETNKIIEASFMVELKDIAQLSKANGELQNLDDNVKVTFLDNKGLL